MKNGYFCAEKSISMVKITKRFAFVVALLTAFALNVHAQNERVMLLESFTNAGCEPCAQQNPALDTLIAANADRVAAIKYHTNWPFSNDPMYLSNPTDIDARTEYYNVVSVPTAIIDGNRYFSTPSNLSQGIIDQLLGIPSPVELYVSLHADTLNNMLGVHVSGIAHNQLVGDIRLFVGIIEKETRFEYPPGPNGEKDFYHVLKKLLPEASGQRIEDLETGIPFNFNFEHELTQHQRLDNLSAVAWIQNRNTKEVYQACKCDAKDTAVNEKPQETTQVFPNPTTGILNIMDNGQKITLYNMIGQRIYEGHGDGFQSIDLKPYGSGIYILTIGNQAYKIILI